MTTQNARIEFCRNAEWVAAGICDEHDLDHGAWLEEVAAAYTSEAVAAADKLGLTIEAAHGQRLLYHGWNGAHFDGREGVFGWFGELSDDEQAALEFADAAGLKAAREHAEKIAKMD